MTKHKLRAILSRERFEIREKIEGFRRKLRELERTPIVTPEGLEAQTKGRTFLMAEIAKLQRELNGLSRGSRSQQRAGWGYR